MPTVGTGSCPLWINDYKWSHQAFHMDRMVLDARAALAAHQKRADLRPPSSPSITSLPPAATSVASLPPNLVSALDRVSHLPLLLIEVPWWMFIEACNEQTLSQGICVLNEPCLADICNLKFFLEVWTLSLSHQSLNIRLTWPVQINETTCRARRQERGEWGEVGVTAWFLSVFVFLAALVAIYLPTWFIDSLREALRN